GGQILSTIERKIEHEIDQVLRPAIRERRLQRCEVRRAGVIERHNLPVDDGVGQARRSLGNSAELAGPVETFARKQLGSTVLYAELHAVAIELDLMHALRRTREGLAELGRDKLRQCA